MRLAHFVLADAAARLAGCRSTDTTLAQLLAACALLALAGCHNKHIFIGCGDGDRPPPCEGEGCWTPSDPDGGGPSACVLDGDCEDGARCDREECVPSGVCETDDDCDGGDVCDFRGTCVAPSGCRAASDCAEGEVCLEGACTPIDDACRFDVDCGAGRGCIDNACRPLCTSDAECTAGTACDSGRCAPIAECASSADCDGEHCVEGRCFAGCASEAECTADERCTSGVCRPDVAPRPFCASDADCAPGHLCLRGVCRTPCPSGTDDECARWDSQFVRCGESESGQLLCYTHHEWSPQCTTAEDCAGGSCVDAICH